MFQIVLFKKEITNRYRAVYFWFIGRDLIVPLLFWTKRRLELKYPVREVKREKICWDIWGNGLSCYNGQDKN